MEDDNKVFAAGEKDRVHLSKQMSSEELLHAETERGDAGGLAMTDGGGESEGEGSNVVFSREAPLLAKDTRMPGGYTCASKKLQSRAFDSLEESEAQRKIKEKNKQEKKLSRHERIEIGRMFQEVVSSHEWGLAENLINMADPQTLNDALCIVLDSIWFLRTSQELDGITGLIKMIVHNGASDFTRAVLRTSFLASCVSACQRKTVNLADTVGLMAQRLHERLQECHGDEVLKAEAAAKVQKFTEWALKCIGLHSQCQESKGRGNQRLILEHAFP